MSPDGVPISRLYEGQVGYIIANMKKAKDALIGDTLCLAEHPVDPLPGFKPAQAMVRFLCSNHDVTTPNRCYISFFI